MSENNNKRTGYLVIIFLLLLVNFVGAYFLFTGKEENDELTVEIAEVQEEYGSLQQDFNTQLLELNAMKGQNFKLDSIIGVREADIQAHLAEIDKWKKNSSYNKSQLNKAKESIIAFEQEKIVFQQQLDDLFAENEELKVIQADLENDLASEKEVTETLTEEKEYLTDKFELGSLLQADELTAIGIKVKDNGVEKEVGKVKNVEKLMVCYQTGVNKVREPGPVDMQLRVISPTGGTLYVEEDGSGTTVNKENGEELRYTKQATFEYDNTNKKICMYWSQGVTESGTYKVMMYQEGYLIGETSLDLN